MLYGLGLWSPYVHFVVTAVHIFCGVYYTALFLLRASHARHGDPDGSRQKKHPEGVL